MILINRNYRLLWLSQLISQLGDKAYNIALMWWLLEKTKSSLMVSSFMMVSMLPELIFGPVAGVYIDRWNKQSILVITDFIRGAIVLLIAALYQCNHLQIHHIYLAALGISFCSALFNPTTMAVIPAIVEKDQLREANAMNQLVSGSVSILGPLLGASSVAVIGYLGALAFNGLSYLASGIAECFLKFNGIKTGNREPVIASLIQGFRFIRANQRISVIVLVIAVVHVFVGSTVVLLPFVAKLLGGTGINNLGVLQAAVGLGMTAGAIYVSKFVTKDFREKFLFYAIIGMGLGVTAIGVLQQLQIGSVIFYSLVCIVIGLSVAVASVFWRTIAQMCVPAEMTGRVFSVFTTTGNISVPISIGAFGLMLNYISPGLLASLAGVCLVLIGILLLLTNGSMFDGDKSSSIAK